MPYTLAFIGLGSMGMPMARNLLAAGYPLRVWNRSRDKAESLARGSERVYVAEDPRDCADTAEAIVTMVRDDAAMDEVAFGAHNLISATRATAIHIGMGTHSPEMADRLVAQHKKHGSFYIAAPVFGRPTAAESRKLWIVAAGPAKPLARCRPIFDALGQGVIEVGEEPRKANVVKLAGNLLIASMLESLGEVFTLGEKEGIAPESLLAWLNQAIIQSPLYERYGGIIARGEFTPPGFDLAGGLKDVKLALSLGDALGVPLPVASLVRDRLVSGLARGHGDLDWSALTLGQREAAGLEPRLAALVESDAKSAAATGNGSGTA